MKASEFSEQLINLEKSLLRYAYFLRLNDEDAKDLVQDTFLKAILNRDKFVDKGFFKTWTFTIMRNTFINNYKHNVLRRIIYDSIDSSTFVNQKISSYPDSPESVFSFNEISLNIEQLDVKFKIPFKMFIEGYRYKEIADANKLKIGTVKSRIFLARKLLMKQINK